MTMNLTPEQVRREQIASEAPREGHYAKTRPTTNPNSHPGDCGDCMPSWEECIESRGIVVTGEHREAVAKFESIGITDAGYMLAEILRSPPLSVTAASEAIRKFVAAGKRGAKAGAES